MPEPGFLSIGNVRSLRKTDRGVEFACDNGRVRVSALTDTIVRVRTTQAPAFGLDFSYAIAKQKWPKFKATIRDGKTLTISTKQLQIAIEKSPLRIDFCMRDGRLLNRDEPARGMGFAGPKCRTYRELAPDEMFFGCGERVGLMNKRGQSLTFWNTDNPSHTYLSDTLYVSIPFLISTRPGAHYGIFFDNTHRTFFNLGQVDDEKHYFLEADAGELDYYFIAGDSVSELVRGYTALTGRMWMPPKWALGFQQCRWSYMSAIEMLRIARNFRRRKIPCDVLYCDIDYMDGYRVWTWNPKTFPKPREFVKTLRKMGFSLVTIIDPGVKNDDDYVVCRQAKSKNMCVRAADGKPFVGEVWPGPSVFPDFTSRRVRKWWGQWHKDFLELGVAGFWNDMNEPAVFDTPDHSMPLDNVHEFDGHWTTHRRAHNVYGFNMARACYEGLRTLGPNQRPFVITRAGFAGIQRFAMVWTGDNNSTWEQFAASIPECIGLGLSGVPFCGPDVGGFGMNCTGELLVRWTQAGAFFPFFRNHSAIGTRRQEVWTFGREVEEICRKFIRLRYSLLPYLYGLFREAADTGAAILRPLFWEFPEDPQTYATDDQFLLGHALLVAPVLKPATRQRAVHLPAGAEWYDFWTKQKHAGGQYVTIPAPLDTMPLFVRAGSIMPMCEPFEYVGQRPVTEIFLDVYPANDRATGTLYEDDGESFDYERGDFALTKFTWINGELRTEERRTRYQSATRKFTVRLVRPST
jgi:alpha-glucosidase